MDKLLIETDKYKPHILILSEHGLKEDNLLSTHIEGYTLNAHYCRKTHLWGGIAIFVNTNVQTEVNQIQLNELSNPEECLYETLVINIKLKKENIVLLATYRSPSTKVADFLDKLGNSLQQLLKTKTNLLILGDTNLDISKTQNKNVNDLSNLLEEHGCYIYNIPETRTTAKTTSSIDGCYTNIELRRISVTAKKIPSQTTTQLYAI